MCLRRIKMKNSKQVILMRTDLQMRKGKMVAQGSHSSLAAYKIADKNSEAFKVWDEGLFKKICVQVSSEEELLDIYEKAKAANLTCVLIEDSGLTEFHGVKTKTCLCIGPNWDEEIDPITGHLKLL